MEFSQNHNVLFELPLPEDSDAFPVPRIGEDKWDSDHVKLPSSKTSKYEEIGENDEITEKSRWDLIRSALSENPISSSREMEEAIKKYNNKYADQWSFNLLHELFEDEFGEEDSTYFFENVMPKIIDLALELPELIKCPIPLLRQKMNSSISLSQQQASCLLANAFLCTFPGRNIARKHSDFPEINFNRLFCSKGTHVFEKLKCILNYFKRVCCDKMPRGVITFQRRFIEKMPNWKESNARFSSIKLVTSATSSIENVPGCLQVDFANRYLGGGVLGWGCVQEEIRFVINPEMIVGMLFCESMTPKEAIVMIGCEQFNKYIGYSQSFQWAGSFRELHPRDDFRRKISYVVAINALSFHKRHLQFEDFALDRELNKAHAGFFHDINDETLPIPVCSGNWGCGVFRGYKLLKALLQLMACCENRRNLFYCTFGDTKIELQILEMFDFLSKQNISVGELRSVLTQFRENKMTDQPKELYSFVYNTINLRKKADLDLIEMTTSDVTGKYEENNADGTKETDHNRNIESPPLKRHRSEGDGMTNEIEPLDPFCLNLSENQSTADTLQEAFASQQQTVLNEQENVQNVEPRDEQSQHQSCSNSEASSHTCPQSQKPAKLKITDFFKPKQL